MRDHATATLLVVAVAGCVAWTDVSYLLRKLLLVKCVYFEFAIRSMIRLQYGRRAATRPMSEIVAALKVWLELDCRRLGIWRRVLF